MAKFTNKFWISSPNWAGGNKEIISRSVMGGS
jgi:hypothetical protein